MRRPRLHPLLLAGAAAALIGAVPVPSPEIVVVVNDRLRVDAMTTDEVREVFLGERQYWDGTRAYPVAYADGAAVMRAFLRGVLRMSAEEYRSWWIKRIFRWAEVPPARAGSPAEALQLIASTPGGIGFLYADDLAGASGVRAVLRVAP